MLRRSLTGLSCLALLVCSEARGAVSDPSFVESPFISVAGSITSFAWAPDGSQRLFLLRKSGEVLVVENGVLLAKPFATVTPIVTSVECGLLGIAFDPSFMTNGYIYLFVTVSSTEQQIVRYTANGNVGENKTVVVAGLPTLGKNHDGGALGFGPDGKLYWAVGDNGSAVGVGDDLASLAAKIGRANRDGTAPSDNPFFDAEGPNNDYIWARGFRNPFTLTFRPSSGRLWLDVVGTRYEQVFAPSAGDNAGWNTYEANQPAPFPLPVIAYPTNTTDRRNIPVNGVSRKGGVVTLKTNTPHRYRPGTKLTVVGVGDPTFNGDVFVTSTPSSVLVTFDQAGADAASGGGTVTSQALGGCITGGTFWDSSAVPTDYRGDFMFGDYNSGQLMRAKPTELEQVKAVDVWGTGVDRVIDVEVGPDGDLYYVGIAGSVLKARYASVTQALVVSKLNLRVAEGGQAAFNVRLSAKPAPGVKIMPTVRFLAGDSDITVESGARLTFDESTWDIPQRVVVAAADDTDAVDDEATIRLAAAGTAAELVVVRVTDDDASGLIVTPSEVVLDEGSSSSLQLSLTRPPAGAVSVAVTRGGDGSVDVSPSVLTFDAKNWQIPQAVGVSAAQDDDAVDGAATLTVSATGLPSRVVNVVVKDDDEHAPTLVSEPVLTAVVNAPYRYDVDADGLPQPMYELGDAPAGMKIDVASGVIEWLPQAVGTATVLVRAKNGVAPDASQSFSVQIVADQAPTCRLTAPAAGAALQGTMAEFFGDVLDDVAAVGADFEVDGVTAYEDVGPAGHYHFGGEHNSFDTTAFADGAHVLAMVGHDSSGKSCRVTVDVRIDNGGEVAMGGAPAEGGAAGTPGDAPEVSGGERADAGAPPESETSAGGALVAEPSGTGGEASATAPGTGCDCGLASGPVVGETWWLLGALSALWRRRRHSPAQSR